MTQFHVGRGFTLLVGLAALLGAAAVPAGSTEPLGDAPLDAVWKPQRLVFQYRGDSSFYSCHALATKVTNILLSIGARDDVRISHYACNEMLGSARFEILFHSPVAATPENIQSLTTHTARDELIARGRGEQLAGAIDLPRFTARWKKVSFASDRRMRLEPADCELVRAVRKQIFAHMSVSILNDGVRCSPGYGNIGPPNLTVAALVLVKANTLD